MMIAPIDSVSLQTAVDSYISMKLSRGSPDALSGFFSNMLVQDGPLGFLVYAYLMERVNQKISTRRAANPAPIWGAIQGLLKNKKDIENLKRHLDTHLTPACSA